MKWLRLGVWLALPVLMCAAPLTHVGAQEDDACPALVESTLATVSARCAATARSQACYGSRPVQATAQPSFGGDIDFAVAGDRVNVAQVSAFRVGGMDLDAGEWGVALMRVQANAPGAPAADVTLLLFGDVTATNGVDYADAPPMLIEVFARQNTRVREGPSTNTPQVGGLQSGQQVTADGRLANGQWIRIRLPDTEGARGWVFSDLLNGPNLNMLKVVDPAAPPEPIEAAGSAYAPMQVFTFEAGQDAPCAEAANGILIQTPEGEADVTLVVNGVTLQLASQPASTAYLETPSPGEMAINLLEGAAQVTATDVVRIVPSGARVRVPLDDDLSAAGAPEAPEPYDARALRALPLAGLEREVSVAPAASPAVLDALNVAPTAGAWQVTLTGEDLSCPGARTRFPLFPEAPYNVDLRIEAGATRLVWGQTRYTRVEPGIYEAVGSFVFRDDEVAYANTLRVLGDAQIEAEIVFSTEDGCTLTATVEAAYAAR